MGILYLPVIGQWNAGDTINGLAEKRGQFAKMDQAKRGSRHQHQA